MESKMTKTQKTATRAKGAARNVAAVAKAVNLKKVGKVVQSDQRVQRVVLNADAKIVVLPAGKTNPRREGTERWKRYEDLLHSKTVGAFLAKHPKWHATITRCVIDKLIEVR
jgi:hypothetical protein